jgi:hypothetical protein
LELLGLDYLEGNMKLSDHADPVWDCTFCYSIRPRIYTKKATDTPNIKLIITPDGYIEGFDLLVNNTSIPNGEKERDKLADCLERILTIKSGMTLDVWPTRYRCKDKVTGHSHRQSSFIARSSRHGWIDVLNLSNKNIQNFLSMGTGQKLEYLSEAVSSFYEGRLKESIITAFQIIERERSPPITDYKKFRCIRNILVHKTLEQYIVNEFKSYFGKNANNLFDFKKYDPNNGIISLDLKSSKTKTTLNNLATDLINDCKRILGL